MTFELSAARIVAPYLGNTIYIWTSIIGVILAALATGYSLGGLLADKRRRPADIAILLLGAAGLLILVNLYKDTLLAGLSGTGLPAQWQALLASLELFLLPTIVLGMVPPYLIRLNIRDLASSGRRAARMNASETVGSLAGTFLTGFVLFEYIGTARLLSGLAIVLLGLSATVGFWNWLAWRSGLLLGAGMLLVWPVHPPLRGLLADIDTAYARYTVRQDTWQGQTARTLQTSLEDVQSVSFVQQPDRLAAPYVRAFAGVAASQAAAGRQLIIGGGAFTLPDYLARTYPRSHIDTVEIDGRLPAIAQRYFGFQPSDNLRIIGRDGRTFLNLAPPAYYDSIYLDAFASQIPPFQLLSREATLQLRASLRPGGSLVAVNVLGAPRGAGSAYIAAVAATYASVFPHTTLCQVAPQFSLADRQNILLLASNQPINQAKLISQDHGGALATCLRHPVSPPAGGFVLRDDYAPIERLLRSQAAAV